MTSDGASQGVPPWLVLGLALAVGGASFFVAGASVAACIQDLPGRADEPFCRVADYEGVRELFTFVPPTLLLAFGLTRPTRWTFVVAGLAVLCVDAVTFAFILLLVHGAFRYRWIAALAVDARPTIKRHSLSSGLRCRN